METKAAKPGKPSQARKKVNLALKTNIKAGPNEPKRNDYGGRNNNHSRVVLTAARRRWP